MNSPDALLYSKLLVEEYKDRGIFLAWRQNSPYGWHAPAQEDYLNFLHSQLTHGDQTDPYWLALREINEAA